MASGEEANSRFQALLTNPHYTHYIPKLLGHWKSTIIRFLFSTPSDSVQKRITEMQNRIWGNGLSRLLTIQYRTWGRKYSKVAPASPEQFMECAKYLMRGEDDNFAIYLATDNAAAKAVANKYFGTRLFFSNITAIGPSIKEFENVWTSKDFDNLRQEGVMLDWWMLSQGEIVIYTASSNYGITAADKGGINEYPNRFVLGGLTQCEDPERRYYLEKIYYSPLEIYKLKGRSEWLNYVH